MFYPYTLQQILLCSIPMPFSRIFSVLSLCPSADSSMFYPYTLQQILLCSIPMPFSRIFSVLSLCPSADSSMFYPYTLQQILLCSIPMPFRRIFSVLSLCPSTDFFCSFIHSGHFYSAPSSPLLLRGAPDYSTDTVSEFHAEAHRQLQVQDLSKVPRWRLERESNPRPSG